MKTIIIILGMVMFFSFSSEQQEKTNKSKNKAKITQSAADSVEYELLVFDGGFEAYLAKVPYSKEYHTKEYYKNWNIRYVTEWNIRAHNPARYGDFYENQIDYQSNLDYGLDLNFKLYQYFRYIEDTHGIVLIRRI